jgi:hypothetical protein
VFSGKFGFGFWGGVNWSNFWLNEGFTTFAERKVSGLGVVWVGFRGIERDLGVFFRNFELSYCLF